MDILIHIALLVIIAGLFFINTWSRSYNPMMFVIIFSLLGLFFIMQSNIVLVDYTSVEKINGTWQSPTTDLSDAGVGIVSIPSFFVLVYIWMFFIAAVNISTGDRRKEE